MSHLPSNIVDFLFKVADPESYNEQKTVHFLSRGLVVESLSRNELYSDILACAQWFQKYHAPNSKILLIAENNSNFLRLFYGILAAGSIAVVIQPPIFMSRKAYQEFLEHCMHVCKAKTVVSTDPNSSVKPWLPGLNVLKTKEILLCKSRDPLKNIAKIKTIDEAIILMTSGTAGLLPKAVVLTHGQLISSIVGTGQSRTDPPYVGIGWQPFHHSAGLFTSVILAFARPSSSLYSMKPFDFISQPLQFLKYAHQFKANIVFVPPFACKMICNLATEQLAGIDLSHIHTWSIASERITAELLDELCLKLGPFGFKDTSINCVYGMSENVTTITGTSFGNTQKWIWAKPNQVGESVHATMSIAEALPNSIRTVNLGKVIGGTVIKIIDQHQNILPDGYLGELAFKGESLMKCYCGLSQQENSEFKTSDGYFKSGDLGFIQNGNFYFWSRIKEVLIINGKNYNTADIELKCSKYLSSDKKSLDTQKMVVFSLYDKVKQTEVIHMVVEIDWLHFIKKNLQIEDSIKAILFDHFGLSLNKLTLIPNGMIPTTRNGKVRRNITIDKYCAGTLNYNKIEFTLLSLMNSLRSFIFSKKNK